MSQVNEAVAVNAADARPMRADARRNREELLVRAGEVFAERGVEASLEEIARRANVGIGTLYRHFPNRDALVEATYRHEVASVYAGVDDLLEQHSPDEALTIWMRSFATFVGRKRGIGEAIKAVLGTESPVFVESHQRIREAIARLLDAAAADGSIRGDVAPDDLLRAMGGICLANTGPEAADRIARTIDLLIDGLRYGAAGSRSAQDQPAEPVASS